MRNVDYNALARRRAIGLASIHAHDGGNNFDRSPAVDTSRWHAADQGDFISSLSWQAVVSWIAPPPTHGRRPRLVTTRRGCQRVSRELS
jgi:hypothetical protein